MYKSGFYDLKTGSLLEVEDLDTTDEGVTMTSMQLTQLYKSRRHKMPSSIWVAFQPPEKIRLFMLDERGIQASQMQSVLGGVEKAVKAYMAEHNL